MSCVLALLKSSDRLKFGCFSSFYMPRAAQPGFLGEATNFAKGALIGGIVVLTAWLVVG